MQLPRDIPTYASILQQCYSSKNLLKLQSIHALTIKLGISSNECIRSKLIPAYSSCAQMNDAHIIFSFSNRQSTFLYTTLIRGYASIEKYNDSLSIFARMILAQKPINEYTLPAVLKSVAALSVLRVGKRVHGYVLANGFGSDLAHCSSLITMYGKCGDLGSARKVFDGMPETNMISLSAMVGGYAMHGEFMEVFGMFDELLSSGVSPDEKAFTTVLSACSHGGFVEKGEEYFEMMRHWFGMKPRMEHYTCMVDMLGRAGKIEEAREMIESMEMEPDNALWRALLGACRFHGKLDIVVRGVHFEC